MITHEERKMLYTGFFLLGKPEGYRPLGRSRRIGEDNIKVDI